jgi:hypothetical protein
MRQAPNPSSPKPPRLPEIDQLRRAVEIYLDRAYGGQPPEAAREFIPPADADSAQWLMAHSQRDPRDACLANVRSFALRIGNSHYPHMKLRLSRPPREDVFLFSVDSHDAFLTAPPGSADAGPLEELKRHNASVAGAILSAWEAEKLLTERSYLRQRIRQARFQRDTGGEASGPPGGSPS